MKTLLKKGYTLVELTIVVCIVSTLMAMGVSRLTFSDGSRVGVITKLSHKGVFFKTWEAVAMIGAVTQGQGGSYIPESWAFTVIESALGDVKKAQLSGQRVELVYHQRPNITPWKSDTGIFVNQINKTDGGI